MPRLAEIKTILEQNFPLEIAAEWDNVGLQFGDLKTAITGVGVALDLTSDVLSSAIKNNLNLLVLHHPFIFAPTLAENIALAPYKAALIAKIKSHKIAIYALHTTYDQTEKGMIAALNEALPWAHQALKNVSYGQKYLVEMSFQKCVTSLKTHLNIAHFQTNVANKAQQIKRIAVLPGAAATCDLIAAAANVDLVVSSEIKWSDWITAQENKIQLLQVPHLIEQIMVQHCTTFLKKVLAVPLYAFRSQPLFQPI